jgi:predicted ribosome quality control (RQC) complex YloA/Tae2 family protein
MNTTTYLPKLFIRNIGNTSASQIYQVIEGLGLGMVTRINFRANNAIVYLDWDIPNTRATRVLLQEGEHPLLLYYSDNRFWKVFAYKTFEERESEFRLKQEQEFERLAQERRIQEQIQKEIEEAFQELEKLRLDQEREEQEREEQEENDRYYSEYIQENLVTSLDYGNVAKSYPKIRANIRARIGLV